MILQALYKPLDTHPTPPESGVTTKEPPMNVRQLRNLIAHLDGDTPISVMRDGSEETATVAARVGGTLLLGDLSVKAYHLDAILFDAYGEEPENTIGIAHDQRREK